MWRQRIVSQFVAFIAASYNRENGADGGVVISGKKALMRVISSLLKLAAQVPIAMTNDIKPIMPIIVDLLQLTSVEDDQVPSFLVAIAQLLALSTLDTKRAEQLALLMERILLADPCPASVSYAALNVLELLTKRASARHVHWESTLSALHKIARSSKRALRQKAALVRNLW